MDTRQETAQTTERLSLTLAGIRGLLIGSLAFKASLDSGGRSEQLAITEHFSEGTNAVRSFLKDAETGQRGFLLTEAERYLELPMRVEM